MGKQYRFSMGEEDENLFIEYLLQNNYSVYEDNKDGKYKKIDNRSNLDLSKNWFIIYLHKDDFGELRFKKLSNSELFLDTTTAPVIEFTRTIIRHETKKIQVGRIWAEMKYYDEDGKIVKKNDKFNSGFNDVKKWINKKLMKTDISSRNFTYQDCHISQALIKLIEENNYQFE